MYDTRNDLPVETRRQSISILNLRLADAIDLRTQVKQAHWNVRGANFIALHELFDQVADRVEGHVDMLAERITALGGIALGTVAAVAGRTSLAPYPLDIKSGSEHLQALAVSLAAFAAKVRAAIDATAGWSDVTTSDLFTQISGEADKDLWLLEAHTEPVGAQATTSTGLGNGRKAA